MVTVVCRHCGDRYEADVSLAVVEWVPRCRTCGRRALVELEADAERDREDRPARD
jgi:hypothetical protein